VGFNELPLSIVLSWYEHKAACILLTLPSLGIKNILPEQAKGSPEEPIFVLTSCQLREIIVEATKLLESKVDALEARIISQDEKIRALEATQDSQAENELNMLRLINDLRSVVHKEPIVERSPLIDELYNHMKAVGLKQTTFAGAAKILKVTKGRVHQFKAAIALDQRFIIAQSESHKQRLVIRLKDV
jgi:hypothetical protein